MELPIYHVDAFTETLFGGNPACVVPLNHWLPDSQLLKIAQENQVAETAFFIDQGDTIRLRWFTPEIEIDLCGHATLATAHCLKSILHYQKNPIVFETGSGTLIVEEKNGLYTMNFPSRMPIPAELPEEISKSLNIQPREILKSRDYLLVYENETDIRNLNIDPYYFNQINLDPGGVCVTAKGDYCDFVSRFFTPQASILEDPVTGSAHCSLIPFWSDRLQKKKLYAQQISQRLGKIYCENLGDRVLISGHAATYSIGKIWID